MSEKEWYCDVYIGDLPLNQKIIAHEVTVRKSVTDDIFTASFKWVDNGTWYNTLVPSKDVCGETVTIIADTIGGAGIELFKGRIRDIGQVYTGEFKGQAERYIEAVGYGYSLQRNIYKRKISANDPRSQFETLAVEAVNAGLIKGYNIAPKIHVRQKPIDGNREYWDMFRQIAEDSDWDFYVDNKGTLHAFPRGENVYPNVIKYPDFNMFEVQYNFDMSNIINTIQIWGRSTIQIGSDAEYTESLANWSGDNLKTISGIVGTYAIYSYKLGSNPYLERTLNIDVRHGGRLHFRCSLCVEDPVGRTPPSCSIEIIFYSSETAYFSNTIGIPGGQYRRARYLHGREYAVDWVENHFGFNLYDPTGWSEYNNPDWSTINKVRFRLVAPVPKHTLDKAELVIDDLFVDSIYDVRQIADTISISKYGLYEGKIKRKEDMTGDEAEILGSIIINMYKEPRTMIENIRIENGWDINLGDRVTIEIYNNTLVGEVRGIEYTFDGKALDTRFDIAERKLPSPELMFKTMYYLISYAGFTLEELRKHYMYETYIDTGVGLLDLRRVKEEFPLESAFEWKHWDLLVLDRIRTTGVTEISVGANYMKVRKDIDGVSPDAYWYHKEVPSLRYPILWKLFYSFKNMPQGTIQDTAYFFGSQISAESDGTIDVIGGFYFYNDTLSGSIIVYGEGVGSMATIGWDEFHIYEVRWYPESLIIHRVDNTIEREYINDFSAYTLTNLVHWIDGLGTLSPPQVISNTLIVEFRGEKVIVPWESPYSPEKV